MFVRDWMSSPAVVVAPNVTVVEALAFMDVRRIGWLPVLEEDHLLGLAARAELQSLVDRRRGEAWVKDVMKPCEETVAPDETLEGATRLMLHRRISCLPVVERGQVAGIFTRSDIFRALCDILGADQPGARVVLSVSEGEDLPGRIARHLNGMSLRSLAALRDADSGSWKVVVRICGREAEKQIVSEDPPEIPFSCT